MQTATAILAIVISLISLAASSFLLLRQTSAMRHANHLPVMIRLVEQVSSLEFQTAEEFILSKLAVECDANDGISGLPAEQKAVASKIIWHFNVIGLLITQKVIDERLIIPLFGFRIERMWHHLEPFIQSERQLRGDYYSAFFEDLVCRVRANWPPSKAYKIKLKRLSDDSPIVS